MNKSRLRKLEDMILNTSSNEQDIYAVWNYIKDIVEVVYVGTKVKDKTIFIPERHTGVKFYDKQHYKECMAEGIEPTPLKDYERHKSFAL